MSRPNVGTILCSAFAGLALASTTVNAEPVKVIYMGELTCGEWMSYRDMPYTNEPKAGALNWILGFLSASAIDRNADILHSIEPSSVAAWMDNYCSANPLEKILSGANVLRDELVKRRNEGRG